MIKKALIFLGMFLSMLVVCAEDNVLQSIEIIPVKDTYNIVLTADQAVDVKKTVQAPNKITLEMKGIRASKTLNTIYNNASNVDTVMVEPSGNGISLFFQAENASNASITFDSIVPPIPVQTNNTQKVKLNNPIESYAPIYHEDFSQQKTTSLFNKISEKSSAMKAGLRDTVDDASSPDTANRLISIGLVAFLTFAVIRLFRRKEPDMKIGLSQGLNEREIEMYRGSHQPLGNNYANMEKPFTTINYGLNAYQKGSANPYETESVPIHNPRLRNYISNTGITNPGQATITQPAPQSMAQTATAVQTQVRKHTTPVNTAPVNQSNPNIDNLKFLESMTAIYEKSGRHDLAQGLKASLSKNNIKA